MPADRHLTKPDDGYHAVAPSETGRFCYCQYFYSLRNFTGGSGLHPHNVEGFSCYLSASKAEEHFAAGGEYGHIETLCSYHKTFIGAAQKKVLLRNLSVLCIRI